VGRALQQALLAKGIESYLLCARNPPQGGDMPNMEFLRKCWHAINHRYEQWRRRKLPAEDQCLRSANLLPGFLLRSIRRYDPDLVHLHWINSGTLSVSEIQKIDVPVVWTLHDMWPLTGSSHCAGSLLNSWRKSGMPCTFADLDSSGYCRQLEVRHTRKMLNKPDAMICPSEWMFAQAEKAPFMENKKSFLITNCIDLDIFTPTLDKKLAKKSLGLPENKHVLLFVSSWGNSPVKGFDLLDGAFSAMPVSMRKECVVAVLGGHHGEQRMHGMKVYYMGNKEGDRELARVYQAADVFVCPSREDNYPNTVVEASACGVSTVGFSIGGLPDLVEDGVSGVLVEAYDTGQLSRAIVKVLKDAESMGAEARRRVEARNNDMDHAEALLCLYKKLLA